MSKKFETKPEFQGQKCLNAIHIGEKPQTTYRNSYESVVVQLVNALPKNELYYAMFTFIMGSYGNSPHKVEDMRPSEQEIEDVIEACLNFEALPLAMEIPVFTFKIQGIDRIITHQIVRSRIGVTFSQHCTGDNDVRHVDFLLPHRMANVSQVGDPNETEFVKRVKKHLEEAKELYAEALDNFNYSIQDARHILPQCLDTYIYMHCNYMMLRNFVSRRWCTNETPQMHEICRQIKQQVGLQYPILAKYLLGACDVSKRCHFRKNNSVFGGSVCFPCGKHPRKGPDGSELGNDPEGYVHPFKASQLRRTVTNSQTDHSD